MALNGGKWYMKKIAVVLLALNLLIENFSYNTLFNGASTNLSFNVAY